jgi:hypothetical protein
MLLAGALVDPRSDRRFVALGGRPIPTSCGFRLLTGLPCPSCGLTRSVSFSVRAELRDAVAMHPLGPAVALAALLQGGFLLLSLASPAVDRREIPQGAVGWAYGALLVAVMLAGVARLCGVFAWPPL